MPHPAPNRASAANKSGFAVPVLYLLLSSIAAWVQWNKWQAFHHTKNLVALVVAASILFVAAAYLLRGLRSRHAAGL